MNCVRSYLRCAQVLGREVLPGVADDPGAGVEELEDQEPCPGRGV